MAMSGGEWKISVQNLVDEHSRVILTLKGITARDPRGVKEALSQLLEVSRAHMYLEEEVIYPQLKDCECVKVLMYHHAVIWQLLNDMLGEDYPKLEDSLLLSEMISIHTYLEEQRVYPLLSGKVLKPVEVPKDWRPALADFFCPSRGLVGVEVNAVGNAFSTTPDWILSLGLIRQGFTTSSPPRVGR